ncbi:GNAT family N-acetyltransferase [Leekyejoonella antrihumi]|uniref:GNAT family N-acetyltransferase n=1 Tax=Leekyejoonella antrihumi TaxID=1660198 RepID=A0A563DU25_9MICO|nr:GNAT family N-acetyltransferase [Leekyejoonella antrihumi]TWP33755.1 GNAT family N-acetyltransferase [Leekyejoonella antrihumi]
MNAASDDSVAVGAGGRPGEPLRSPEAIRTDRLVLVPMSTAVVRSILRQDWAEARRLLGTEFPPEWREDGWRWLEPQAERGERDDRYIAWGTRLAFATGQGPSRVRGAVLAEVGFHGPPDTEGGAEIGYRVVARYQRQGLAEEAAWALLRWAYAHGVSDVRACVSPDNAPSMGLLYKLGFTEAGHHQHSILGEQLVFRRRF